MDSFKLNAKTFLSELPQTLNEQNIEILIHTSVSGVVVPLKAPLLSLKKIHVDVSKNNSGYIITAKINVNDIHTVSPTISHDHRHEIDEFVHKALSEKRSPEIVCKFNDVIPIDASNGWLLFLKGHLNINDVNRNIEIPFTYSERAKQKKLSAKITLKPSDFNIDILNHFHHVLKIHDEVILEVAVKI